MTLMLLILLACGDKDGGDGTTGSDGGLNDGGSSDGGGTDGGTSDGGAGDGGSSDGGTSDGGTSDGGTSDGGTSDGGTASNCSLGSGWKPGGAQITAGGTEAWRYVPADLPACAPVVFFGHGGSGAGAVRDGVWDDPMGTGLIELADSRGFVLIAPGANEAGAPHSWSLDDTGDLHALADAAAAGVDVDEDRIWFIGQSAGCHMAVYTGLYDPGPFDAIGAVSGGIGRSFDYPTTEPAVLLPFYVAHDPDDSIVPYSYSEDLAADLDSHGHNYLFEDWDLGSNGHGWNGLLSVSILTWLDGA